MKHVHADDVLCSSLGIFLRLIGFTTPCLSKFSIFAKIDSRTLGPRLGSFKAASRLVFIARIAKLPRELTGPSFHVLVAAERFGREFVLILVRSTLSIKTGGFTIGLTETGEVGT